MSVHQNLNVFTIKLKQAFLIAITFYFGLQNTAYAVSFLDSLHAKNFRESFEHRSDSELSFILNKRYFCTFYSAIPIDTQSNSNKITERTYGYISISKDFASKLYLAHFEDELEYELLPFDMRTQTSQCVIKGTSHPFFFRSGENGRLLYLELAVSKSEETLDDLTFQAVDSIVNPTLYKTKSYGLCRIESDFSSEDLRQVESHPKSQWPNSRLLAVLKKSESNEPTGKRIHLVNEPSSSDDIQMSFPELLQYHASNLLPINESVLLEFDTLENKSEIVNTTDTQGNTPLHLVFLALTKSNYFAPNGSTERTTINLGFFLTQFLLESGSNLLAPNNDNETPLKLYLQTPFVKEMQNLVMHYLKQNNYFLSKNTLDIKLASGLLKQLEASRDRFITKSEAQIYLDPKDLESTIGDYNNFIIQLGRVNEESSLYHWLTELYPALAQELSREYLQISKRLKKGKDLSIRDQQLKKKMNQY